MRRRGDATKIDKKEEEVYLLQFLILSLKPYLVSGGILSASINTWGQIIPKYLVFSKLQLTAREGDNFPLIFNALQ